ncbi:MAG: hypothetical protein ABSG81_06960 [Acidimicrobiales bacterium]|jgi:hypothetical protein
MPVPLDEYPVHQVPLSMQHVASSDRNAYDRCYFNAHDRTGDLFLVTGMGVYPNLGVRDAFATLRRGHEQTTLRISDALGADRMDQRVGPYRIEVLEPLQRIRVVCDGAAHGLGFDLTWTGSFPVVEEPAHVMRQSGRIILDAMRFAQVGTWSGVIHLGTDDIAVDDARWVGTRDRSWGIRPIGEPEPPGRAGAEPDPAFGFWWTYAPLRFEEFAVVVIAQETGDGTRVLNEAVRIFPAATGRPPEQLGWPDIEVRYRPGTRDPVGAVLRMRTRAGTPVTVDIETLGFVGLNCGPGYGGDPDWGHGQWRGRDWTETVVVDVRDPAITGRLAFGVVDHVARATCDGAEGWGMFEHGTFGRHEPSGFTGWESVAAGPAT